MYPSIHLYSEIYIPSYYLVLSLVISVCLFWVLSRSRTSQLSAKICLDLSLIIMLSGFWGARLFHVFFESWDHYKQNPIQIFYFWNGGFVFYGGALSAAFFGLWFLKKQVGSLLFSYLDLFAPVLSLAYSLGRFACLLAGCCYGKTCSLPWAMKGLHPTQAYASLWELGVVMILIGLEKARKTSEVHSIFKTKGQIFFLWMVLHGTGRLVMEAFRNDYRGPDLILGSAIGLSVSSWISLVILFGGVLLLYKNSKIKSSKIETVT